MTPRSGERMIRSCPACSVTAKSRMRLLRASFTAASSAASPACGNVAGARSSWRRVVGQQVVVNTDHGAVSHLEVTTSAAVAAVAC